MNAQFAVSVATAFVEILFFGGIIFGFSSLQYILEQEGYFRYLCNNSKSHEIINSTNKNCTLATCGEQESNFNLAFTLGSSFLYFAGVPWGYLLDKYGTWIFRTVITSLWTIGYILLALSTPESSTLLFPTMILFGIAGLGILMSNYQIANLAKTVRGFLITFMNGLFSSAVVVFLLLKTGFDLGTDLYWMLQIMTCLTILPWLRTYLLLPRKTIPFPLPSHEIEYGWKEIKCPSKKRESVSDVNPSLPMINNKEKIPSNSNEKSQQTPKEPFKQSWQNILFWTNWFHYSTIALRISFIFSSTLSWLRSFEDPDQISKLTDDFGFILLFGVCVSPLNGIIIDVIRKLLKASTPDEKTLNLKASFVSSLITTTFSIALSIMTLIPSSYGTFVLLLLTRGFIHGGSATFIAINFPFHHFGKLFGINAFCSGLVSLLQYALFQFVLNFDSTFLYTNILFLIMSVLTLLHPAIIFIKIRSFSN